VADNKEFLGVRYYDGEGRRDPRPQLPGQLPDWKSGFSASWQERRKVGSLYVLAGCTFYGFEHENYEGSYAELTGPLFLSDVPCDMFGAWFCWGRAELGSALVDCRQHYPDCQPEDRWVTVASFDNSQSDISSTFTYKYTIGTTWSHEMSEGMSIDETVSAEMQAAFWGIFQGSLGVSVSTGYNWGEVTSEARGEEEEFSVETSVPGGRSIRIQQTVGQCGGSGVKTEQYRSVVTAPGETPVISPISSLV